MQFLLEREADPNDVDKAGNTPLHTAARCGFSAVCSALLAAGAKANAPNRGGKLAAQVALNADIAKLLEAA